MGFMLLGGLWEKNNYCVLVLVGIFVINGRENTILMPWVFVA
jgi:hypothetical protein